MSSVVKSVDFFFSYVSACGAGRFEEADVCMPQSVMAGEFIYSGAIELPAGESEETLIKIKWTMGIDK